MKKVLLSLISVIFCLCASAQTEGEYLEYPHAFIGVQGGVQTIQLRQNNGDMKLTPSAALSIGDMFNPYLGARLNFQGIWNTFSAEQFEYKGKSVTGDLDFLLNLTNCFRADKYKPFNLYLIAGAGLIDNFDFDDEPAAGKELAKDWWNLRAGLLADYRLSKYTSLNLEVNGNYMGGSESPTYKNGKWKFNAFLGLAFRIPFSVKEKEEAAAVDYIPELPAAEPKVVEKIVEKIVEKPVTVEKIVNNALCETVFFNISQSDPAAAEATIGKVVSWCKENGEKTIVVSGYADKGTGNAKINQQIAESRAFNVADAIKAKGIDADRIAVQSFGDKVQPFSENDKNRCVIVVGQ